MTDLITTTQDAFRDGCLDAYFGVLSAVERLAERAKDNRGQTAAEYMGVLLVISVIIATISTTSLGDTILQKLNDLVGKIAGGQSGKAA